MSQKRYVMAALEVPSGKLVVADSLFHSSAGKQLFKSGLELELKREYCGFFASEKEEIQKYAEQGLLSGYVGNSCPTVYKGGNKLTIGNNLHNVGEEVGQVVTDLWRYCIADHDNYMQRGGKIRVGRTGTDPQVVTVIPGRYVLRHFFPFDTKVDWENYDSSLAYATLTKSNKPVQPLVFPEEILENKINKLSDVIRHNITATKPYREYLLDICFEGQVLPVTLEITANQIKDDLYLAGVMKKARKEAKHKEALRVKVDKDFTAKFELVMKNPRSNKKLKQLFKKWEKE